MAGLYRGPRLREYGRLDGLMLEATGTSLEQGQCITNPTCTNNGGPYAS